MVTVTTVHKVLVYRARPYSERETRVGSSRGY